LVRMRGEIPIERIYLWDE